jgi:hypothetical protein
MTILEGFEDWESDEQADNQSQEDNQFLIDVEAATGLSLGKKSKKKTNEGSGSGRRFNFLSVNNPFTHKRCEIRGRIGRHA